MTIKEWKKATKRLKKLAGKYPAYLSMEEWVSGGCEDGHNKEMFCVWIQNAAHILEYGATPDEAIDKAERR